MNNRIWILLSFFCSWGVLAAPAQDFRNIAGFSIESYFDGTFQTRIENVFLAPVVADRLLVQVKMNNQTGNHLGDHRSLTMAHLGPVILFSPTLYGIAAYGAGFREQGQIVHEGDLQLHRETERYRFGGGVRGRIEPDDDVAYLVPSIGGKVFLPGGFGIHASWFLGIDNEGEINHSLWLEGDYAITPVVTVKLGGSVELGETPGWSDGSDLTYNLISGVGFRPGERVSLRYQLDYIGRADRPDGIRNFVYVDWRF